MKIVNVKIILENSKCTNQSSSKKKIQEQFQKKSNTNILKENKIYMNQNKDPFQDFLNNYNKQFVEEESIINCKNGNSNTLRDSEYYVTNFSN